MSYLNIPLGKSKHKTARHNRRAVWRWGIIVGVFVLVWGFTHAKATSNPFTQHVPTDTRLMIHLHPSQNQWKDIIENAGHEPLIGGLTLSELAPNVKKSFVVFIQRGGSVSLGVEGKLNEQDRSELESYGLVVRELEKNLYLISNKELATEETKHKIGIVERLIPNFAGSIIDLEQGAPHAIIRITSNTTRIEIPGAKIKKTKPDLDKDLIFFSTFSNTQTNVPNYIDDLFTSISGGMSFSEVLSNEGTQNGSLSITTNGDYLIIFNETIPTPIVQKVLQMQHSLRDLEETRFTLPDGSSVKELRTPTKVVEIETIQDGDWEILRTLDENIELFAGIGEQSEVFFTNSADVLIQKTRTEENKSPEYTCGNSGALHISTNNLIELLQEHKTYFSTALPLSNTAFVQVGMDKSVFGSSLRLCNDQNVENF